MCSVFVCSVYLFQVFAESYAEAALAMTQHLAGHQAVEQPGTRQRNAEVEPKQPPVLCVPVELEHNREF